MNLTALREVFMSKKHILTAALLLALSACASSQPRVIQASSGSSEIRLTTGMVTQIEMPDSGRVQSVTVGNTSLVSAEQSGDVVNLSPKAGAGETNLIIRSRDDDGRTQVYQYHITVQAQ
jgi:type IV secretory pathway VirB9-like protein